MWKLLRFCKAIVLSLAALAACAISHGAQGQSAQLFPGAATVIEGAATTKEGRPIPHATLYLLDVPPSQLQPDTVGDRTTVVTDDKGHFTWRIPDSVVILPDSKTSPLPCWLLPADRNTLNYGLHFSSDRVGISERTSLMRNAARECRTSWARNGPTLQVPRMSPFLSVVAPEMGTVNLSIRAPDGKPLRDHAVQIVDAGDFPNPNGALVYEGKTDGNGRLTTRWFEGLYRLQVLVPGIGFGSTGSFELLASATASPEIPPLAPFAHLSGYYDSGSKPDIAGAAGSPMSETRLQVKFDARVYSGRFWYQPSAFLDEKGHWTLDDVLPGPHQIVLGDANLAVPVELTVRPGETIEGIRLAPRKPVPGPAPRPTVFISRGSEQRPIAVRGNVTDISGHPVANAIVYAICAYSGMRVTQEVLKATTGEDGSYAISGIPFGEGDTALHLVAVHDGYAPVQNWGRAQITATDDVVRDLVMPPPTAKLSVRVLRAGKPAANAFVRLTQTGTSPLGFGVRFGGGLQGEADREAADRALRPVLATDGDGRALFSGLTPGLWDVAATDGEDPRTVGQPGHVYQSSGVPSGFGSAKGVVVRAGETGDTTLTVYSAAGSVELRILGPDGKPPKDPTVGLSIGPAVEPTRGSSSLKVDSEGDGIYQFVVSGLWRAETRFRDVAVTSIPANDEPNYSGASVFALSPSVRPTRPVVIRSTRRGPGSIRVRIVDVSGRTVRGSVAIDDFFDGVRYAGSADSHGEVVFPDLPSGSYTLTANAQDSTASPWIGRDGDPLPADSELKGTSTFAPQTVIVGSGTETKITLRAEIGWYIRGQLRVKGGLTGYFVDDPRYIPGQHLVHFDKATGEFVAGPFPSGSAELSMGHWSSPPTEIEWWDAKINVEAGKVAHVILTTEDGTARSAANIVRMVKMPKTETYQNATLSGTVFLPDGVTPAWDAHLVLSVPQNTWLSVSGRTDAVGHIHDGSYDVAHDWQSPPPADPPPGNPPEAVLVAWLPGANGATVTPYVPGQSVKLVLPPPIEVSGTVTLGGRPVGDVNSSFRVIAAYQGKGRLNRLLSVEATAQANGEFLLAGLTPGVYRLQAARDGI